MNKKKICKKAKDQLTKKLKQVEFLECMAEMVTRHICPNCGEHLTITNPNSFVVKYKCEKCNEEYLM